MLKDSEEKALQDFRDYLKTKNSQMPDGYDVDSRLVLRFLQGMKFVHEATESALNDHFRWFNETFPINASPF